MGLKSRKATLVQQSPTWEQQSRKQRMLAGEQSGPCHFIPQLAACGDVTHMWSCSA